MSLRHRIATLRETEGIGSARPPILDLAQFTRRNVIDVTGAASHQLHNWVARKWLTLSGEQSPGKGKRRLYNGCDVITVAFGLELQPFGMMRVAEQLSRTQQLSMRAYRMLLDPQFECGRALAIVPSGRKEGWDYLVYGPGTARSGHDFRAALIIDADRLILETLERLSLVARGQHVPSRNGEEQDAPWSGDLITDDYGDEYVIRSRLNDGF
jgi:hypothetical protein